MAKCTNCGTDSNTKMKRLIVAIVGCILCAPPLMADTETVGGYTWSYEVNGDGVELVYDWDSCDNVCCVPDPIGHLTIPSTLGGKPVTAIGRDAFTPHHSDTNGGLITYLTSVTIPDSVKEIGADAFACNYKLTKVTLSRNLKLIGSDAFINCGLLSITIPSSVTNIVMPAAFGSCYNLRNVVIEEGLGELNTATFDSCYALETIHIPSSITNIIAMPFTRCTNLTSFSVADANPAYKSVSGMILTKNGKALVCGVSGKVNIPEGVEIIAEGAFEGLYIERLTMPSSLREIKADAFWGADIKELTIPDGVADIGRFSYCANLKRITIGSGVKRIESGLFEGCESLEKIVFRGNAPTLEKPYWGGFSLGSGMDSCRILVGKSSTGWGVDIPGRWQGFPIEYDADIPELADNAGASDISSALAGAEDEVALVENITTKGEYEAFRKWAYAVKDENGIAAAGTQAVLDSPCAWLLYALGSDRLLPGGLMSDDVKIESFAPAADIGKFSFEVSLADIGIGEGITITDNNREAVIANLNKVLGVEGSATLTPPKGGTVDDLFSSANVEVSFDEPKDGKARFTAMPSASVGDSFFMRVKVKQ